MGQPLPTWFRGPRRCFACAPHTPGETPPRPLSRPATGGTHRPMCRSIHARFWIFPMVGRISTKGDDKMKSLFTTTAIVLFLGLPVTGFAQTAATTTTTNADAAATTGFLANRAMSQMLATDLIGHDVYARRIPVDMTTGEQTTMANVTAADLDGMDNVGQINDLVLSNDGSVAAIVIGVGGFLGVGEQDVAVTMNEVSFATNPDKAQDIYIIVNTSGEMMKTSPNFDRNAMADVAAVNNQAADNSTSGTATDRAMLTAPMMKRDGYNTVKATDLSIDMLIGKTVYGTDDSNVGTISDVTVDTAGAVQKVVIDFGGFLGMGTAQVALSFDELTILTDANNSDIRVYVDATKEQIKAMPIYTASN